METGTPQHKIDSNFQFTDILHFNRNSQTSTVVHQGEIQQMQLYPLTVSNGEKRKPAASKRSIQEIQQRFTASLACLRPRLFFPPRIMKRYQTLISTQFLHVYSELTSRDVCSSTHQ